MRKWILAICCLALATPAWAQGTTVMHDPAFQPVNYFCRNKAACCPAPSCPEACPQKVCVRVPTVNTKVVYSSACVEYCRPKCTFGKTCDSCADNCGPVHKKNVLMKRVVEDCPGTKCVPGGYVVKTAPCATCAPGFRLFQGHHGAAAPSPAVETVPVRPMPVPKQ